MLEWILSSSVLIGTVLALRWLFRNKLKMTVRYALWGLVLVRLLLPFSIGEAMISVGNCAETLIRQPAVQEIIEIQVPVQSQESAYQEALEEYRNQGAHVDSLDQNTLNHIRQEAGKQVEKKPLGELLTLGAKVLWITGCVLVSGFFLFSNCRFGRNLRKSRRDTGLRKGKLPVYVTEGQDSPCLFGPGIYVTEAVLSDPTLLRHTLEHEATHYRHGDHIWSVLRGLALAMHWYNPLVWFAAILSQRDGEMACDEATVARLGEGERAEYGRTLIGMTCGKKADVLLTATRMTNGSLRERILMIAHKPKMAGYILAFVVIITAVVVGCTFTGAGKGEAEPTQPTEPIEEIWDTKPYITYDGTRFYTKKRGVQSLPEGYEYIGILSEEDSRDLIYGGYQIFALKDQEKPDHFYLYGETGTIIGNTYYDNKKQMAYTLFGTEYYILPEHKQAAQEDVFFRKYDPNGLYLGKADGCAVIYSDGEIPQFRVLRYTWEEETVRILEEQTVEAALTEGITVNHLQLESGHMYFGSVADREGTWKTLELTGKGGSKAKCTLFGRKAWFTFLNWTVEDFRVLRTDGTTVFNMTENTVNEIAFVSQAPTQPPTEPEETTPAVSYREPVPAEVDDPNLGPLYSETDPSLFSIIVQPTGVTRSGDHLFYVIPENQDAFLAAYKEAAKHAYQEKSGESEASTGIRVIFQNSRWELMENGALEWFGLRIDPEHTGQLPELCREAVRQVGVQDPVRAEELKSIRSATLEWMGTEYTVTQRILLSRLEEMLSASKELPGGAACPFGNLLTLTLANGESKIISMGADDCCTWMSNGVYYKYTDGNLAEDIGNTVFYSLFLSEWVREQMHGNPEFAEWMTYVNWSAYDAVYGGSDTRKLLTTVKEWIQENQAYSMTFFCMNGLDKEYTPLYAEMLAQIAEKDPKNFAYVYFGAYTSMRARITELLALHWNLTPEQTEAKLREIQ